MGRFHEVLDYWFGDNPVDLQLIRQKRNLWFGKDKHVDDEIRKRFSALVEQSGRSGIDTELSAPERLGKIILLDQFPRNIFRGTARAFAFDPLALALALEGLAQNQDHLLRPVERAFFYLPLEHSEQLELQDRSVVLFRELMTTVPEDWKQPFNSFFDYALRHREIIARFGRFPHRNEILGRVSTAEELKFLAQPNSSF